MTTAMAASRMTPRKVKTCLGLTKGKSTLQKSLNHECDSWIQVDESQDLILRRLKWTLWKTSRLRPPHAAKYDHAMIQIKKQEPNTGQARGWIQRIELGGLSILGRCTLSDNMKIASDNNVMSKYPPDPPASRNCLSVKYKLLLSPASLPYFCRKR